nr:HDOD domain-containing protein [Desulfobulbaceae bacterium]
MTRHTINKHIDVNSIPTLPAIAMEAIRLLEGEESSFESVADLLKNDQVLAGRILHYANSAFIGARVEVTTISRAISLLGFNTIRSLILSVTVFDCFKGKLASKKDDFVSFWLHSIGVAVAAEVLAKRLYFAVPEEAYLAGLVHDIGKLVCYLHLPEQFARVCGELEQQGGYGVSKPIALDLEDEVMGTNHTEVGKLVAEQWMFPEQLVKAMWLHHQPVFETILPEQKNLFQVIRFADALCVTHHIGSSYFLSVDAYDHEHFHYAMEKMMLHHNLSIEDVDAIVIEVKERVEELSKVLGIYDKDNYTNLVSSANASLGSMSINLDRQNKELVGENRVLDATYKMTRRLKSGMALTDAIQEVLLAARDAFGVSRILCMVIDKQKEQFVGVVSNRHGFDEFVVPANHNQMQLSSGRGNADIESEAIQRLKLASVEFDQGSIMESGVAEIVAGSEFMASFFVADKKSHGRPERIIGELMIDFQGVGSAFEKMEGLSRNFEIFSSAAANSIERILLVKDLHVQAKEMAETSRKMEESQRQLFHSHRLATVGRLAAGAAHEINNPLTIISLNIQLMSKMLSRTEGATDIKERLDVISGQEKRISKIIGDLMGFARPTQPKLSETDIWAVMEKVLALSADRSPAAKIEVENYIPKDLPNVFVDASQIEQVLINLLINANHAMPGGGKIILRGETNSNGQVAVTVTDTGTGIAKDNLAKIFDPFFTTKKEGEGTGLGLAISHSIMEQNHGALRVSSEIGKGTTFTVLLPVDQGGRLRALKKAVDQKVTHSDADEVCRVLVVDDEKILNEMLQECLKSAGYEVDGAYDGVEGIGLLRYKKYHLILLDIRMPRKDGLEVLQFVKVEYPDIPVIIVTGLASLDEIKETVAMGAFACLKKPFVIETVLAKAAEAIADSCQRRLYKK